MTEKSPDENDKLHTGDPSKEVQVSCFVIVVIFLVKTPRFRKHTKLF